MFPPRLEHKPHILSSGLMEGKDVLRASPEAMRPSQLCEQDAASSEVLKKRLLKECLTYLPKFNHCIYFFPQTKSTQKLIPMRVYLFWTKSSKKLENFQVNWNNKQVDPSSGIIILVWREVKHLLRRCTCLVNSSLEEQGMQFLGRPAVSPTGVSWWLSVQGHLIHQVHIWGVMGHIWVFPLLLNLNEQEAVPLCRE